MKLYPFRSPFDGIDLAVLENMMGTGIESRTVEGILRAKKYAISFS